MRKMKKLHTGLLLCSILVAGCFLLICSKSSPLYPMNDWVDVNCFFTVGKSILHGMTPYLDIYEQKGPVLYLLYAVAAWISEDSFIGVFLLEMASFTLFLYFSGKLAQLYLGDTAAVYLVLPVLACVIALSPAFTHGGSVEQLCLFMIVFGLYSLLRAIRENRAMSFGEAFTNGIFAAMILWIKYTMLGFYIGLALAVLLFYAVRIRSLKALLRVIGQFLLGVAAITLPVLLWFAAAGGLSALFTVYFYNNIFLYTVPSQVPFFLRIASSFATTFCTNLTYSWLLVLGLVWLLHSRRLGLEAVTVLISFLVLLVTTYWGGRCYPYYGLILSAYALFGLIGILYTVLAIARRFGLTLLHARLVYHSGTALLLIMLLLLSHSASSNTYLLGYDKHEMPQFLFAETIRQVPNATLLNYGFLDGGFYHAAGVIPNCRFFCTFNVDAPEMWETHERYVEDGLVDFVVTRGTPLHMFGVDCSHYSCVARAQYSFEGVNFIFFLYQKT